MPAPPADDNTIHRLPDDVVNTIAAGEVVERPASIVKELIENSLDAGASHIAVRVEAGGRALIEVTDDGCGMGPSDARACLERHATSKIRDARALFSLTTLGFRGEALPSISAVSKLSILSRLQGQVAGTRLRLAGAELLDCEAAAAAPGTQVRVEDLFFNVPVRKKFLRQAGTEFTHVSRTVGRLALANPGVGFSLHHGARAHLQVSATASELERAIAVLGKDASGHLYPFQGEHHDLRMRGLLGDPSLSRRGAGAGLSLFVNGRYVRDRQVGHAVQRAFGTLIDRGRSPVVVLHLGVPGSEVDVNVHPQKLELRFANAREIYDGLLRVLGPAIAAAPWVEGQARRYTLENSSGADSERVGDAEAGYGEHRARVLRALERFGSGRARPGGSFGRGSGSSRLGEEGTQALNWGHPEGNLVNETSDLGHETVGFFGRLRVLGQFQASFILCEGDAGLVILDQHAAHERMVFESLREAWSAHTPASQRLLVPRTLTLGPSLMASFEGNTKVLASAGIELEALGEETLAIRAVPAALPEDRIEETIRDTLGELSTLGESAGPDRIVEGTLATIACHSVVRANELLDHAAMAALVAGMDGVPRNANCPHGRPVAFALSRFELEHRFKRR